MPILINAPVPAPPTSFKTAAVPRHPLEVIDAEPALDFDIDDDGDVDMLETAASGTARTRGVRKTIVTPGELVTEDPQWMRGHGTATDPLDPTRISSTVAGTLTRTNKLLSIAALRSRYTPEIGDLVVGRIAQVGAKRWSVDIGGALLAALPLSSISLPGGVQRRRTAVDELNVRAFFAEGDLLVAEVQTVRADGGCALHTRNTTYGKLRNGLFVAVAGAGGRAGGAGGGIVRSARQLLTLEGRNAAGKITVVLGVNGYVWIQKHVDAGAGSAARGEASVSRLEEMASYSMYSSENDVVRAATRHEMHVLAGCVRALTERRVRVDEGTLLAAYAAVGELELEMDMDGNEGVDARGYMGGEFGRRVVDYVLSTT